MLWRIYERAIATFGVLFAVFLLAYWVRSIVLAVISLLLFAGCKLSGVRICDLVDAVRSWVEERESRVVCALLVFGLLLRLLWLCFLWTQNLSTSISDYELLWKNAQTLAQGHMPISKSWMTAVFYAFGIKLFGVDLTSAYVMTMLLQLGSGLIGYWWLRKMVGAFSAVLFLIVVAFSLNIVVLSTVTATENLFAFFLVLSVILVHRVVCTQSALSCSCLGCILWLATWSRGEGIVLWVATFVSLICVALSGRIRFLRASKCCFILAVMFVIGAFSAILINEKCCGDRTIFCSNDNLIPRYMGSLKATSGRFSSQIYDDFDAENGAGSVKRAHSGEREIRAKWFGYLKERTAANWGAMNWGDRVILVIKKEVIDWWGYGTMGLATTKTCYEFLFAPFAAIMFSLTLVYFMMLFKGVCMCVDFGYLGLVLGGVFCALMFSEAQPRYGYLMYWISAFYIAFVAKELSKKNKNEKFGS